MTQIRNILFLTDFSSVSDEVFNLAKKVAIRTQARLHVYHNLNDPIMKALDQSNPGILELQEAHLQKVNQQIDQYVDNGKALGIPMDADISEGALIPQVKKKIQEVQADLIMMGSNDKNLVDRIYMGSNSRKIVRKIHIPILISKLGDIHPDFKKAIYVSGLDENERECFRFFLQVAKQMGIKEVHVLTIDTSSYFSQPTIVMKEALKEYEKIAAEFLDCKTHFEKGSSVTDGIQSFMEANQADLIGIANDDHSPLKRILFGNKVEMLLAISNIPVMAIDFDKSKFLTDENEPIHQMNTTN